MEEGEADRRRHRIRMTAVVASPPRKAQRVTVPGELMVTAVPALAAFWAPASRAMMARAAPKAAPWDTPSVEAAASGLRRTFCITQPDNARAAPTTIATVMRGRRTWNTMARLWAVPPPARVSASSGKGKPGGACGQGQQGCRPIPPPAEQGSQAASAGETGGSCQVSPYEAVHCADPSSITPKVRPLAFMSL